MELMQYAAAYLEALCEGTLDPPPGLTPGPGDAAQRAAQLQPQIAAMGLEEFVRRCAAQRGDTIDPAVFEPAAPAPEAPEAPPIDEPEGPHIEEPDGPRSAFAVLLDCCLLDDGLFQYLIQLLKTGDTHAFEQLALVCCRKAFPPQALLDWLQSLEQRGDEIQRRCAGVMDRALLRLSKSGQLELLAALLSGDAATYDAFRTLDPELKAMPEADYDWYERNYVNCYYPVRFMLRFHGAMPAGEEGEPV